MNEINIAPSEKYVQNNIKIAYRPNSSKIVEKKTLNRVLSTGNVMNLNHIDIYKNYSILPSLYNTNGKMVKIKKNILGSNSMPKKNNFKIEFEKLYDQNINFKKTIIKLKAELNIFKNELTKKQDILNSMNEEIEYIINENQNRSDFGLQELSKRDNNKYNLIRKMKSKIKEAEEKLNEAILKNKNLRKNIKYTKLYELEIEKIIINEQKEKIMLLIENSKELKNNQDKELYQNIKNNSNLEFQKKIISNFHEKLQKLAEEEKNLQCEIVKYENILNKTNDKVKIIKLKQITLKNQNMQLTKEKNDFKDKNKENKDNINNNYSLDYLQNKLYRVRNEFKYNKIKNQRTMEKLNNAKKNYNSSLEKYKSLENKSFRMEYDHMTNQLNNNVNDEEYINKLKQSYQENKDRENELEHLMFLFQEAIQKMNQGEYSNIKEVRSDILKFIHKNNVKYDGDLDEENNYAKNIDNIYNILILSDNNPYCTTEEDNDPFISKKFTNEQFKQFTYVLFKNFEAKKLNYTKAKEQIINPLLKYIDSINISKEEDEDEGEKESQDIQEKMCLKFVEIVLNILNCSDEKDYNRLKIFFNAIYFDKMINTKEINNGINKIYLISNYFLSLFNYIHEYNQKNEEKLKYRIGTTYIINFIKFRNLLRDYMQSKESKENSNESNEIILNTDYISINEIKTILEQNPELKFKEKYIEFIIYIMKQFDDNKASLFDLKISKLDEMIKGNDTTQKSNNVNYETTESIEEITPEDYNKNINSVLTIIKQLMMDENKDLRQLFGDSIVTLNKPRIDAISLESFNNVLNQRNINLNYLQLSCFNNKFCVNKELHALDVKRIEEELNNI